MFTKLEASLEDCGLVTYEHPCEPGKSLNALVGSPITLSLRPELPTCLGCARPQKKILKGYCYRCSIKLACCDLCILKPELCHFDQGTCREPEWGLSHCFRPHQLYIALSSSLKVGLSRSIPSRWIDQGARQAAILLQLRSRKEAGLIERYLIEKLQWNDKTNWRNLVKGVVKNQDQAQQQREALSSQLKEACEDLGIEPLHIESPSMPWQTLEFPVESYVNKPQSWNLMRDGPLQGTLTGICGQYLLFAGSDVVVNMRNYGGYPIYLEEGSQCHH